jgi:hypothetical protein
MVRLICVKDLMFRVTEREVNLRSEDMSMRRGESLIERGWDFVYPTLGSEKTWAGIMRSGMGLSLFAKARGRGGLFFRSCIRHLH